MGANNGVGGVDVGLGKNKDRPKDVIAGPGTATLHFPARDMGALMAAHGQYLAGLVADYPVDPAERAAATVHNTQAVKKGWTRVTFSNPSIRSVKLVKGGAVEVTVLHSGASKGPATPSKADTSSGAVQQAGAATYNIGKVQQT